MKYFLLLSLLVVAACGVKPGQLDAPSGDKDKPFPRTYPASQ